MGADTWRRRQRDRDGQIGTGSAHKIEDPAGSAKASSNDIGVIETLKKPEAWARAKVTSRLPYQPRGKTARAYRATTDEKVNSLDAVTLCVELGRLPDECKQLRRLEKDPGPAVNGNLPRGK
jgi:hypothetical protein